MISWAMGTPVSVSRSSGAGGFAGHRDEGFGGMFCSWECGLKERRAGMRGVGRGGLAGKNTGRRAKVGEAGNVAEERFLGSPPFIARASEGSRLSSTGFTNKYSFFCLLFPSCFCVFCGFLFSGGFVEGSRERGLR